MRRPKNYSFNTIAYRHTNPDPRLENQVLRAPKNLIPEQSHTYRENNRLYENPAKYYVKSLTAAPKARQIKSQARQRKRTPLLSTQLNNLDFIIPIQHAPTSSNFQTSRIDISQQEKLLSLDFQIPQSILGTTRVRKRPSK